MAIGEAVNAVGAEDPTCFRAAEPNMNDPPPFAEVSKRRGNRWDFKDLYALSANGTYSPSKMGEVGIHLACN